MKKTEHRPRRHRRPRQPVCSRPPGHRRTCFRGRVGEGQRRVSVDRHPPVRGRNACTRDREPRCGSRRRRLGPGHQRPRQGRGSRSSLATTSRCSSASPARVTWRTTSRASRTRTLTDVDTSPFEARVRRPRRQPPPGRPGGLQIWVASEQGSGKQTLNWEIEDGDYSVVVMNADGSAGVDADISTGANVPFLDEIAWTRSRQRRVRARHRSRPAGPGHPPPEQPERNRSGRRAGAA